MTSYSHAHGMCVYTQYMYLHAQMTSYSHAHNSYLPVIGVHEMHGRMHPNYWQITILLVVDLCSPLAYFMMTQPPPIVGKLPIKTLVAKQLPTNTQTHIHTYTHVHIVYAYVCIHVWVCDRFWVGTFAHQNTLPVYMHLRFVYGICDRIWKKGPLRTFPEFLF